MSEEDKYVIHGPESDVPLPNSSLGREIFEKLLANMGTDDAMVSIILHR